HRPHRRRETGHDPGPVLLASAVEPGPARITGEPLRRATRPRLDNLTATPTLATPHDASPGPACLLSSQLDDGQARRPNAFTSRDGVTRVGWGNTCSIGPPTRGGCVDGAAMLVGWGQGDHSSLLSGGTVDKPDWITHTPVGPGGEASWCAPPGPTGGGPGALSAKHPEGVRRDHVGADPEMHGDP